MKFELTKTSDYKYKEIVEIGSLEDLVKMALSVKIIVINDGGESMPVLEIYDGWRE